MTRILRHENRFQYCLDSNGTFCTCVLSKATLEETKLIHLCRTMWNSRATGLHLSRWFSPVVQFYGSVTSDCRRERFNRRTANHTLHRSGSHERTTRRRTSRRERASRGTLPNEVESVQECSLLDPPEKCSRQRIGILANEFQRHHPRRLCANRLSCKSGTYQNRRNVVPKDSFIATSANIGYRQKYLASTTRGHGETCSRPNDDNTQHRLEISRCPT